MQSKFIIIKRSFLLFITLISLLVIYGWLISSKSIIQIHPNFAPMQYITALCFLLSVLIFYSFKFSDLYRFQKPSLILLYLLSGLTLIEYASGFNFGFENLLGNAEIIDNFNYYPGRMSIFTSSAFFIIALVYTIDIYKPNYYLFKFNLLLTVFTLGITSLFFYLIDFESTISFEWDKTSKMGLHTSINFIFLSTATYIAFFSGVKKHFKNLNRISIFANILLICFILGSYLTLKSSMKQNKYFIKQVENIITSHTNFLVHDDTIINEHLVELKSIINNAGFDFELLKSNQTIIPFDEKPDYRPHQMDLDNQYTLKLSPNQSFKEQFTNYTAESFYIIGIFILNIFSFLFYIITNYIDDIRFKKQVLSEITDKQAEDLHYDKLATIGELSANIGHEINNPLAIVKGFVFKLKRKYYQDNENDFDNINQAIIRVENIVNGLRTYSRSDTNIHEDFFIIELIKETINLVRYVYAQEDIQIEFQYSIDPMVTIHGNKGHMQQVFMNLLSNARDAIKSSKEKTISISIWDEGNLAIYVNDSGHGILPANKDKVFDSFFTTKGHGKGTGIGLSTVKALLEDMHGSIKITKNRAKLKGACFCISIPFKKTDFCLINEQEKVAKKNKSTKIEEVDSSVSDESLFSHLKVLIVDDEEGIREYLQDLLAGLKIMALTAANGEDALNLLAESNDFDMVISDLNMPGMKGDELIKKIRSLYGQKYKCFFITGGVSEEIEKNVRYNKLVDGYFYKPFDEDKIESMLKETFKLGVKDVG